MEEENNLIWEAVAAREGEVFQTRKGKVFSYHMKSRKNGETQSAVVIDSNRTTITRATLLLAAHRAMELQEKKGFLKGPGKLGTFGAEYLYPIFLELGLCTDEPGKEKKPFPEPQFMQEETKQDGPDVCPDCKYVLQDDFDFCPKCGKRLK